MPRVARRDGWSNFVTGLGDAMRDKRLAATVGSEFLRQDQAEQLWRGDDMAARAIEKIPQDALRRGFRFTLKPNAGEEEERGNPTGEDSETAIDGRSPTEWETQLPGPEAETRPLGPGRVGKPSRNDAFGSGGPPAPKGTDPTMATEGQEEGQETKAQQELVNSRLKKLGVRQAVLEAAKWERAYGGAAIFMGTVDRSPGRSASVLARPLDLAYVEELKFLTVLSPKELVPYRYYGDPLAPKYGEVQIWSLVPKSKGINPRPSVMRVHESRLVLFPGNRTSRFMLEAHRGFGDSILNRIWQHVRNFSTAYDSAAVLIHDFSQAIWKFKGLVELMHADPDGLVQKRAAAMDYVRSTLRAMVIDSEEEFERKATPVTGLPDLLDRMANRLAAATGMPVTMLMGQEPAGLNATGQANRDWYNENVEALQTDRIVPAIERIVDVELHATQGVTGGHVPDGWAIEMAPLEAPSEKEESENRLRDAQAVGVLIDRGVVMPEEAAQSMFGGEKYSRDIKLNADVREAALEAQEAAAEKAELDPAAQVDAGYKSQLTRESAAREHESRTRATVLKKGPPKGKKPPPKKK